MAITLCFGAAYPRSLCPACVAYFLAPHCCRCCRTNQPLVKVAGVACSAMRVDSISNISIHPSIHPPVHLPMTRQLRTSERLTAVHCLSTSTRYPFGPRPFLCGNKCNYVFELYSKYTRATHAPSRQLTTNTYRAFRQRAFPPVSTRSFSRCECHTFCKSN